MPRVSCLMCGERAIHRHHVCYRQWVRDPSWSGEDINHPDNLVPLCLSCHGRHHSGFARIPLARLPDVAVRFAYDNGLGHRLERQYDTEEPVHGCAA